MKNKLLIALGSFALASFTQPAEACTRVVYKGDNNLVLTARSMDWKSDIESNIWVFPRGMERQGLLALTQQNGNLNTVV